MKISELKPKQGKVEVTGTIKEISPAREFQKFGRPGKVANASLADDSGSITLTLWNEDVDKFKTGDEVTVKNGYVSEWQGELQLSGGRYGTVEHAGEASSEDEEELDEDEDVEEEEPEED